MAGHSTLGSGWRQNSGLGGVNRWIPILNIVWSYDTTHARKIRDMRIKTLYDVLPYPGVTSNDRDFLRDDDLTYDWHDFSVGVDVDSFTINQWLQDCLDSCRERMLKGEEQVSSFVRSGNTIVTLFAYLHDGTYDLHFIVTKGYLSGEISGYDPTEDVEFEKIK